MQDLAPLVIAVCGLTIVFVGLILFGLYVFVRKTGIDLFDTMGAMEEVFGGDDDDPADNWNRRRDRPDLRSRAQSTDFDAALAKYTGQAPPPGAEAQQADTGRDESFRRDRYQASDRSSIRRRRRERGDVDDEVFGGLLDDEGDGTIDY